MIKPLIVPVTSNSPLLIKNVLKKSISLCNIKNYRVYLGNNLKVTNRIQNLSFKKNEINN